MALNIAVPLSGVGGLTPISPIGLDCWENIKMLVSPIGSESSGVSSLDSEEAKLQLHPSPPRTPEDLKIICNGRDILDLGGNIQTNPKLWNLRYTYLPENNNIPMFLANRSQYHRLGANGHIQEYSLVKCDDCDYEYPINSSSSFFCKTSITVSATTNSTMTYTGLGKTFNNYNNSHIDNSINHNFNSIHSNNININNNNNNVMMKRATTVTTNITPPLTSPISTPSSILSSSSISSTNFNNNNNNNISNNNNSFFNNNNINNLINNNNNNNNNNNANNNNSYSAAQKFLQSNSTTKSLPNGLNNLYTIINSLNNNNNNSNNNNNNNNNIFNNCGMNANAVINGFGGGNQQNYARMYKYF